MFSLPILAVVALAVAGCSSSSLPAERVEVATEPFGPGGACAASTVIQSADATTNLRVATEQMRRKDYCGAYPYLRRLLATAPLFDGGADQSDQTHRNMAEVYEWLASRANPSDTEVIRTYLDSARTTRTAGRQALTDANIPFDTVERDIDEGFFYYQHEEHFQLAMELEFDAYNQAFAAAPDSLDDWTLGQLLAGSAYGLGSHTPERMLFIRSLLPHFDSEGFREYATAIVSSLEAGPISDPAASAPDIPRELLIGNARTESITAEHARYILWLIEFDPARIQREGAVPAELRTRLLGQASVARDGDNPQTLLSMAMDAYRLGPKPKGDSLFNMAIALAPSNGVRGTYHYARCSNGVYNCIVDIDRALQFDPTHGPSLLKRAQLMTTEIESASTVSERAAYWCIADEYRRIAAIVREPDIAAAARLAITETGRKAPTRAEFEVDQAWSVGERVRSELGRYGRCVARAH